MFNYRRSYEVHWRSHIRTTPLFGLVRTARETVCFKYFIISAPAAAPDTYAVIGTNSVPWVKINNAPPKSSRIGRPPSPSVQLRIDQTFSTTMSTVFSQYPDLNHSAWPPSSCKDGRFFVFWSLNSSPVFGGHSSIRVSPLEQGCARVETQRPASLMMISLLIPVWLLLEFTRCQYRYNGLSQWCP
jgi:hypothetical protein